MRYNYISAVCAALAVSSSVFGSTVVHGLNVTLSPSNVPGDPGRPRGNYFSYISQDVDRTDPTGVGFRYDANTLQAVITLLDEGSEWYVVSAGAKFDAQQISANAFAPLITFGPAYYDPIVVGSTDDIYLGLRTARGGPPIPNPSIYGWVRLRPLGGTLTMIDNSVAYDASGIIVGTDTAIPEPSIAVAAGLFGFSLLGSRLRRLK